ncbi:MAG: tRNA (adenosine(37)-N6)-threonylcarbamoyltransferase complex dimerization subunit type 1 TsaB [Paenibacillaceae bacterium]
MNPLNWKNPTAHFPGRLLALDTSTSAMSIAILEQGRLLKEAHIHADRTHSIHLMPMIKELMQGSGMKFSDLSAIAVGVGPGSYTGVRIGVTAAKTLAWTLKLPILGVSSLEAMAFGAAISGRNEQIVESVNNQPQWIVPMMDARRAQAYTGLYCLQGSEWQCLVNDGIRLVDRWLEQLAKLSEEELLRPRILFIGEMTPTHSIHAQIKEAEVAAMHIGLLGSLRLAAGARANVHQLIPNYTQLTEAENNLLAKSH